MTDYFKPRMDILPAAQQRLWPELHPSIELGLVLYGGTAIALRLGHRASVDFEKREGRADRRSQCSA